MPPPPEFGRIPRPKFGKAAQHEKGMPGPLRGKAAARRHHSARLAAELCPVLPEPGECVHVMMTGHFDLAQVVVDVARRIKPVALRIATLCWNRRNVVDLAGLLEDLPGLRLTLLASKFFAHHNKDLIEWAREQFADQAVTLAAARSHCKVVCFDLGPGDGLVFEGSANLRTNKNREQLILIRARSTHDWHAGWIDELVDEDEGTE